MLIESVGNTIRLMREKQCTRETFALAIHMDTSYLGSIERGERNVEISTLQNIARGFPVPTYRLFREENESDPYRTLNRYVDNHLIKLIRPALLKHYDPFALLALFDSEMLIGLTVQDIENGAK